MTMKKIVASLKRIAERDNWVANHSQPSRHTLTECRLVWYDGEYLFLTERGDDLLKMVACSGGCKSN